ncbi:MAG TPA: tetratricopeptide repeat protein [Candidatus Polarisedimenticolia bacterium]|nr:tetratricopeptide repeat protein [Candidatus Polarisedimenticolia bacterium]
MRIRPVRAASLAALLLFCAALSGGGRLSASEARTVDPDILARRAAGYLEQFRRDDLGQALRLFGQVARLAPRDPRGPAGVAQVRALRFLFGWDPDPDSLQAGVRAGQQAVEIAPESAEARWALGIVRLAEGRTTPALAEMDRAVQLAPEAFLAHFYRGMLLRALRRSAEAQEEAQAALRLSPASPAAQTLLGDCLQDERRFLEARNAYLTAAELDQHFLWARLGLAAAYQKQANFAAAEKTYTLTEQDFPEDRTRIRILAASLLVAGQNYEDAVTVYQGISETEQLSPPLMRRLLQAGRAYSLEKLGKAEEAEYFWSRLVEEFPEDYDGPVRDREVAAQAYEALARIHDSKGDATRADKLLERACAHRGMPFSVYATLAARQQTKGKVSEAVKTLRRGLAEAPPDEDWIIATQSLPSLSRALVAERSASRDTRAGAQALFEEAARKVAASSPSSHVPYMNLARGEALLKMNSQALGHLKQAVHNGFIGMEKVAVDPDFREVAADPGFKAISETR